MKEREPSHDRKVVPIAEAVERRRKKVIRQHRADAMDSVPDGPDEADHLTMLGNMALIEESPEDAVGPFSRALAVAPDDVSARAGRGKAYAALGKHALALADFDRAAKLAPDVASHHRGRATALAMLGRMKQAVQAASRAIELAPGSAGAHYTRAVYRSHVDPDDPGVGADLGRAVELAPDAIPYLRAHIDHLMNAEEYDAALVDLERAVVLAPGDAALQHLHGRCLLDSVGHFDFEGDREPGCRGALAALAKALELDPESELRESILYDIIGAREWMRDDDGRLAALDQFLDAFPDNIPMLCARASSRHRRGDLDGAAADRKRLEELGVQL